MWLAPSVDTSKPRRLGKRLGLAVLLGLGVLLTLGAVWLWRPPSEPAMACQQDAVDPERLKKHVRTLTESFHPRDSAHPENLARAAAWLTEALGQAGGRVRQEPFEAEGARYVNVVATFGPEEGERLIIGAHYDAAHTTPGADDNGSGVAALLELAAFLGRHTPALRVDLVAFTLEEPPFFRTPFMGSTVHARALREAGVAVRAMVSLETMGYFSDAPDTQRFPVPALKLRYPSTGNFIAVVGQLGEDTLVRSVAGAMQSGSRVPVELISAPRSLQGVDFSDHLSFWDVGYPAVMVTDTAFFRNPNYHTPQDTWDTLDYARLAEVVRGVQCAVQGLAAPGR